MTSNITDLYGHRFEQLQEQLQHVSENAFYQELYEGSTVDPAEVSSLDEFQELPFVTTGQLSDAVLGADDHGPFFDTDVNRTYVTPAGDGLMPLYYTQKDWDRMTDAIGSRFKEIGIGDGDLVLNTIGYTPFLAGMLMHDGITKTGAVPVPAGAGDSEGAVGLAELYDIDAAIGFPSYIEKVAKQADLSLDVLISAGEPVIYYPERREELREVVGGADTVVDIYGLAAGGTVAAEDDSEDGMNVFDEYMILEIIDPETGEPVEMGESGEIVLTHLNQEAMPMVRFRTGDVSRLVGRDGKPVLPDGIFGRVDDRLKIKGVKIYPGSFEPALGRFDGLTGEYTLEVSQSDTGTDHLKLVCQVGTGGDVNSDDLAAALDKRVLVSVDEIEMVDEITNEERVLDHRSESIT